MPLRIEEQEEIQKTKMLDRRNKVRKRGIKMSASKNENGYNSHG